MAELEFEPSAFLIPEPEFFHSLEIIFDSWKSLILLAGENPCRNSKMRPFFINIRWDIERAFMLTG